MRGRTTQQRRTWSNFWYTGNHGVHHILIVDVHVTRTVILLINPQLPNNWHKIHRNVIITRLIVLVYQITKQITIWSDWLSGSLLKPSTPSIVVGPKASILSLNDIKLPIRSYTTKMLNTALKSIILIRRQRLLKNKSFNPQLPTIHPLVFLYLVVVVADWFQASHNQQPGIPHLIIATAAVPLEELTNDWMNSIHPELEST